MPTPAQAPFKLQLQTVTVGRGDSAWRTGQGWLTRWTPEMVAHAPDPALAFCEYAQQTLGVPWPTREDQCILRRRVKELLDRYPHADYFTLCRLVQWCRAHKKRKPRVWMVVDCWRDAWVAGALPELDPTHADDDVERRIRAALDVEQRQSWRRRLLSAIGPAARRAAVDAWEAER